MHKYFFRIFLIFFVSCPGTVYSQARTDSSVTVEDSVSVQSDSSSSVVDSSAVASDAAITYFSDDSLYRPVKDSLYLNSYALREVSQPKVNKWLADRDYEYANDPEYWKKDKVQNNQSPSPFWNFLRNKVVQWIVFLALIAVIAYGIFLLAKENNFKWFSRRNEQPQQDEPDSLSRGPVDYDETIRKFQAEGNYRFAIRYLFLRLIHSAADNKIIQIRDSTTNTEIGRAFGQHPLASQFRYLASAYEYIYFGDFNLNKEVFDSLKMKFDSFQEKISV
ncbi:MAG TPA: hypothetical protein VK622_06450 [Puia sp.]|nr:hypothetical protein [Puia sp.]